MAALRLLTPRPDAVPDLRLHRAQRPFVGSRAEIAASFRGKPPGTCASLVIDDPEPVAFVSLRFGAGRPRWASPDAATLHSLMVDQRHQGQGHAMALVLGALDHVRSIDPDAAAVELAVNQRNIGAAGFYARAGFAATGRVVPGSVGDQNVLRLSLG